jgi:hypothetical protein
MIKFIPGKDGKYGKFIFGFKDWGIDFCSWGGVNEKGLFYDWASTGKRNPEFHAQGTRNYSGILADKMLEECSTVDEAIEQFKTYNCPGLGGAHIFIADSLGNSVVIEQSENNTLCFIRNQKNYQIATNFLNSYLDDPNLYRWIQCPRYEYINSMLRNTDTISIDLFREILNHVGSNRDISPTIYSNIYDFYAGKMYIYNYYNFNEVLVLDIKKELKKGYRFCKLPSLFSGIKAISPIQGEIVTAIPVTFKWSGNASEYELWIADDPSFSHPQIISYTVPKEQKSSSSVFLTLLFLMLFLSGFLKRQRIKLLIIYSVLSITACEDEFIDLPESISSTRFSMIVDNLKPNTTYYWKVVGKGNSGFSSESTPQIVTIK